MATNKTKETNKTLLRCRIGGLRRRVLALWVLESLHLPEAIMHNLPIDPDRRKNFKFYNADKPRRSFIVQVESQNLIPSSDNNTVAWIKLPNIGKVKARGFNRKLWFGNEGQYSYSEALQHQELPKVLSVKVSKDTCGDYFASVVFSKGKNQNRSLFLDVPVVEHKESINLWRTSIACRIRMLLRKISLKICNPQWIVSRN